MSELPVFTVESLEHEFATLGFASFTADDAVDLGIVAVALIRERALSLALRITRGVDTVFVAKLGDTGPGNDPWLAGKATVARLYGEPSLLVRRRHEAAGTPFAERTDVDHETHKAHGGCVPIRVHGEVVGTITLSGEPDVIDHQIAAESIRRFLAR